MDEYVQHNLALACVQLAQQIIEDDEASKGADHPYQPKAKKEALQALLGLGDQPYLFAFHEVTDAFCILYRSSAPQSKTRKRVASVLLAWSQQRNIPFRDAVEAAHTLYRISSKGSEERQQAIHVLLTQAQWPDVSMKQSVEAVLALCYASPLRSKERKQGIQVLLALAQRPHLSVEDALVFITLGSDHMMLIESTPAWEQRELAIKKQMLIALARRPDLTSEQTVQIAEALSL